MDSSPLGSSVHGSRRGYWSGLPFPPPGDLCDPGIEPVDCHFLFQGIFPTQGSNLHCLCLLHWQMCSLSLVPLGGPPRKLFNYSLDFLTVVCGQKALFSSSFLSENARACGYCFHTFSVSFQNPFASSPLLVRATETNPKCTSCFLTLGFSSSAVCGIHHSAL